MQPARDSTASAKRPWSTGSGALTAFVDREVEMRRLQSAILSGQSLMICGPSGIGKTALIMKALAELPEAVAACCFYLRGMKDLQDLLRQLIRQLYEMKNRCLRRDLHCKGVSGATFEMWLRAQSSSRLRGTLYRAVEGSDYRIVLDHLPPLTLAVAKVIKELFWMRNTPVYLLPHGVMQEGFGQVSRFFYWGDRERLVLGPLPSSAARELLESCIQRFGPSHFRLEDFREEVLELSGRVPGALTTMCALAADPRYQFGNRIKTKTVYLDYLTKGHDSIGPSRRVARPSDKP